MFWLIGECASIDLENCQKFTLAILLSFCFLSRYDDMYHLHITYINGQTKQTRKTSLSKSVASFFDENGSIYLEHFEPEIRKLHTSLTQERKAKWMVVWLGRPYLLSIASGNGLAPARRQAITWTSDALIASGIGMAIDLILWHVEGLVQDCGISSESAMGICTAFLL